MSTQEDPETPEGDHHIRELGRQFWAEPRVGVLGEQNEITLSSQEGEGERAKG